MYSNSSLIWSGKITWLARQPVQNNMVGQTACPWNCGSNCWNCYLSI